MFLKLEDLGYCVIVYTVLCNVYEAKVYVKGKLYKETGTTPILSGCEWMAANIANDLLVKTVRRETRYRERYRVS